MLRWLWSHSELKSQRSCSTRVVPGEQATVVKRGEKASYRHLIGCKRLDCPVCGPAAAEREAADIALAVTGHYANGGSVAFVTLTLRHVLAQPLLVLLAALGKAWATSRTSKATRGLWGSLTDGYIRKLEVTFGRNGWHPHLHLLVFLKPGVTAAAAAELFEAVFGQWAGRLVRLGLGRPTRERGVTWEVLDLEAAQERVGSYVAKDAGRELASAGTKRGRRAVQRTPFELLSDAVDGDGVGALRYLEYEDAMRGLARVQWSDGLKGRLLDPELRDSGDDDDQGRPVAVLPADTFDELRFNESTGLGPGLSAVLRWAELYDDDAEACWCIERQCRKHGIPLPIPPPELRDAVAAFRAAEPVSVVPEPVAQLALEV
jgi:hypothetical protein